MRPHRIQVSSSRCDRLEEAEELDTSEEPLLRREPLIDRMDLESASSNLRDKTVYEDGKLKLQLIISDGKGTHVYMAQHVCLIQDGTHTLESDREAQMGIRQADMTLRQTVTLRGSVRCVDNLAEAPEASGVLP